MRLTLPILACTLSLTATLVAAKKAQDSHLWLFSAQWTKNTKMSPQPDHIVSIESVDKFCILLPAKPNVDIPISEAEGGAKSFCTPKAFSDPSQGQFPDGFWSNVEVKSGKGPKGGNYIQMTGCFRREKLGLNPGDEGGQYSPAGAPKNTQCIGYDHYVELVEPAENRACLRCCQQLADCPVNKATQGCEAVIPGNYFDCN
ncbi:putative effector protein [Ceratobasidium theobromae]|uniref:Putative effector protein n=1 Tax=Ceratobasidium theobromae TaxID=1582974 RepID=A0A5N5QC98_9AGAM|nr:putative effector protein [Ceratobasidium theobromae]